MAGKLKDNDRILVKGVRKLKKRLARLASLEEYSPPATVYVREILEQHADRTEKKKGLPPMRED